MGKAAADLLVSFGALWLVVGLALYIAFVFFVPFFAFSMARSLKRIRLQLERLNDNLESGGRKPGGSVIGL